MEWNAMIDPLTLQPEGEGVIPLEPYSFSYGFYVGVSKVEGGYSKVESGSSYSFPGVYR